MEGVIRLTVVTTSMFSIGSYALHINGQGDRIKLFANGIYRWHKVGRYYEQQESLTRKPFCRRHWNTLEYSVLFSPMLKKSKAKQN